MKHTPSRPLLLVLSTILLASAMGVPRAGAAVSPPPIPETRTKHSWSEKQRIRFVNSPLLRRAHESIAQADYEQARALLDQILANDPGNNHARVYLINVLSKLGEHARARALVNELLALYPDYVDLYVDRAFSALRDGDPDAAVRDLSTFAQKAPARHPQMETARQNLAEILFSQKQFARAAEEARPLLVLSDTVARRMFLAECALQLDQWDAAVKDLEAALAMKAPVETKTVLHMKAGFARFNAGQLAEADRHMASAEALAAQPDDLRQIVLQRGLIAYRMQRYAESADFYGRGLAYRFDEAVALARLDALQLSSQVDKAITSGLEYLRRPEVAAAFQQNVEERLMNLHALRGDFEAAYAAATRLIESTGEARLFLPAAVFAEKADRLDEAIALYERSLAHAFTPDTALSFHYAARKRASALAGEGRIEEAQALLRRSPPHLLRALEDSGTPAKTQQSLRYELAQIYREQQDMDAYFAMMQKLIETMPEGQFLYEYAIHLYGSGRYDQAMELFLLSFDKLDDKTSRYEICKAVADIHLIQNRPQEAVAWLEKARTFGQPDRTWHLGMARADYQMEKYEATIERLLPIAEDEDLFHMYIGFSFYNLKPQMPGLSLYHMNRIQAPEKLRLNEQFNFFANRAYLHYDQNQDEAALADVERSLGIHPAEELQLVRMRVLIRMGRFGDALEQGYSLLAELEEGGEPSDLPDLLRQHPNPALHMQIAEGDGKAEHDLISETQELMGLASYQTGRWEEAVDFLTRSLDRDPALLQVRYLRGLSYVHLDRLEEAEADLLALQKQSERFPATFWGDLAFLQGHLKEFDQGTQSLDRSLQYYPHDIDGWQERGYQFMKDRKNKESKASFARAIRLYDEVLPYVSDEEEAHTYRETRMSLQQEYAKLDKVWSMQLYGQRTDMDFDAFDLPDDAPAASTQGALQSQGGASIGYRPPKIGFRNERTLDLFVRVLANLEPRSWNPDEDSYQGGAGLTYKPFITHNFMVGFERLFEIGDNSEDNWLWRNTYALEGGERPERDRRFALYRRFYGEASYYLEEPKRWVYFGQGNLGPSVQVSRRFMLTLPEALLVGRYQDRDPEGIGTYWYYGVGLNLRLLEGDRELTRERWALSGYAHYVWGRFEEAPLGANETDFDGWIIGLNFSR